MRCAYTGSGIRTAVDLHVDGWKTKGPQRLAAVLLSFLDSEGQSNAAPTMIFRISSHGDPCEIEFVCVGWPLASPPVPCI